MSERLARETGLGDQEALCFLGVWLKAGPRFTTEKDHKAFRKKIQAAGVRAYADALGL